MGEEGQKSPLKSLLKTVMKGDPPQKVEQTPRPQSQENSVSADRSATSSNDNALSSLLQRVTQQPPEDIEAETTSVHNPQHPDALEAWIDAYFESEGPEERDTFFDRIAQFSGPSVEAFFRAMAENDEDEYVRHSAICELAKRGDVDALQRLRNDIDEPEEPYFFEQALDILAAVQKQSFYPKAKSLWMNDSRDAHQRREAMMTMEKINPTQALQDFADFIDTLYDIGNLPDDQVEQAMVAFTRHGITSAQEPLSALLKRIRDSDIIHDEKQDLIDLIESGLGLLLLDDGDSG